MSRIAEARPSADQSERVTTIEVEVRGRWDALALSELLIPFHSFLVQYDHERWLVHARAPGCHGEPLSDALARIEGWRAERDRPVLSRVASADAPTNSATRKSRDRHHPLTASAALPSEQSNDNELGRLVDRVDPSERSD